MQIIRIQRKYPALMFFIFVPVAFLLRGKDKHFPAICSSLLKKETSGPGAKAAKHCPCSIKCGVSNPVTSSCALDWISRKTVEENLVEFSSFHL